MKILVLARRDDRVPTEAMQPHFQAEVQAIWDLYTQGIVREMYTRADQPGAAILMVEGETIQAARHALAKLPLVELNMIDLEMIPFAPFTNLTLLFKPAAEPAKALA